MNDLEIQELSKRFGENIVVDNISFGVNAGEFFVLLGPSGGGKTTLLRLITGLEKADNGKIFLAGREITNLPSRERNIGMVFQDYGLYPHMNVSKNISYGLEARGMPRDEIEKRVSQATAKLGLTEFLSSPVVDLSGGEQQRVALARAMAKDAELYLFDEPLSNLDPKLRAQARRDIQSVHREKNKPTLYVTHDQSEALAIGDRIGVIAHGQLQQVGTTTELIDHPANLFMAGFIGSPPMNLIAGRVHSEKGQYSVDLPGFTLPLSAHWKPALERFSTGEVVVGIRPASFMEASPFTTTSTNPPVWLTGQVTDVEPLIGETILTLDLGNGLILNGIFQMSDQTPRIGQNKTIGLDPGQIHLFNPESGQAIYPAK
jgi:multiple sugar transport system ATP-binding protein